MPTTKPAPRASGEAPAFPLDLLRARADRLARAAKEACRQHERCGGLCDRDDVDGEELRGWLELAAVADRLLADAVAAYEKAGAKLHPEGEDGAWWHKANALWLAAREHVRRHEMGDRMSKRVGTEHSVERLTELHVEYALEASAVLSLQQAAETYCKVRPTAL
jgi:hypothetical protein